MHMVLFVNAIASEGSPAIESRVTPQTIRPVGSRRSSVSPMWIDRAAAHRPGATIPALCTSCWNRWFNSEESLTGTRRELVDVLESLTTRDSELRMEMVEHSTAEPVAVSPDRPLVKTWQRLVPRYWAVRVPSC